MLQYLDPYQYLHVYLRVSHTKNNHNTLGNVRHSKSRDNNFSCRLGRQHAAPSAAMGGRCAARCGRLWRCRRRVTLLGHHTGQMTLQVRRIHNKNEYTSEYTHLKRVYTSKAAHSLSANYELTNTYPTLGVSQNKLNSAGSYTKSDKASCASV